MAFPTAAVLDDFNRTDAGTLGSNWSRTDGGSALGSIVSNQCALGDDPGEMHWNAATFGPDCEAYVTVATLSPNSQDGHGVAARLVDTGGSGWDGYVVYVFLSATAGADTWEIYRVDDGVYTRLGAQIGGPNLAAGDGIGIECIGDQISAYHRTGGTWSLVGTRTDATHDGAGAIGMYLPAGPGAHDDFGGGTIGDTSPEAKGGSETLPVILAETATIFATSSRADTATLGLADTSAIQAIFAAADTLTLNLTGASAITALVGEPILHTTDWHFPAAATNVDNDGGTAWSNPTRVRVKDASYASAGGTTAGTSDFLVASDFGFTTADIPADATPKGVEVRVRRRRDDPNDTAFDHTLQLVIAGTPAGDNQADTETNWPAADADVIFGGAADLLGTTPTAAQAIDAGTGFRVAITFGNTSAGWVDSIEMRWHYTLPHGPVEAPDSLTAALTEAATLLSASSRTDALALGLSTETAAIVSTLSRADSLALNLSGAATLLALATAADTLTPALAEAASIGVTADAADTLAAAIAETATLLSTLSRSDAAALGLTEASTLLGLAAPTDTAGVALAETAGIASATSLADTAALAVTEAAGVAVLVEASDGLALDTAGATGLEQLGTIPKDVADTLRLRCDESSTVMAGVSSADTPTVLMADQSTGVLAGLDQADQLAVGLDAAVAITAYLQRADAARIAIADTADLLVALSAGDTVSLAALDASATAALLDALDTLPVGVTEAAVRDALLFVLARLEISDEPGIVLSVSDE